VQVPAHPGTVIAPNAIENDKRGEIHVGFFPDLSCLLGTTEFSGRSVPHRFKGEGECINVVQSRIT